VSETAISGLLAWQALDSRGTPTVACELRLQGGARGQAIVPSGASTGRHEAVELRDRGEAYGGRGVLRAVAGLDEVVAPTLRGVDAADQSALDRLLRDLDGTSDLSRLGANALLAVSIAAAVAVAEAGGLPLYESQLQGLEPLLPLPMVNVISGGAHARGLGPEVQDFLAVPVGAGSFAEAIDWCWRTRAATASIAAAAGHVVALVADEGGLALGGASASEALEVLCAGIEAAGLVPGGQVAIAVDVAATQLLENGLYGFNGQRLPGTALLDIFELWCEQYPLVSLEDPVAEDDWDAWREATQRLGNRLQLVGDDLFTTNVARLERGIQLDAANALLVKPNQCGTLTDARGALELAASAGYATVISARSGDTEDAWLADLAVGWRSGQIKVGSTTRSERTAKWNRLLKVETELGDRASFAGGAVLRRSTARPEAP
jgi:enolase